MISLAAASPCVIITRSLVALDMLYIYNFCVSIVVIVSKLKKYIIASKCIKCKYVFNQANLQRGIDIAW